MNTPLYTTLRAHIVQANPDIQNKKTCPICGEEDGHGCPACVNYPRISERKIGLCDVLLALDIIWGYSPADIGGFTRDLLNLGWNLREDDLSKSNKEIWKFLLALFEER